MKTNPLKGFNRATRIAAVGILLICGGTGIKLLLEGANPASLIIAVAMLLLYFLPTLYADYHQHRNANAIALLNLLLGWTVVGWVISAVWASYKEKP